MQFFLRHSVDGYETAGAQNTKNACVVVWLSWATSVGCVVLSYDYYNNNINNN